MSKRALLLAALVAAAATAAERVPLVVEARLDTVIHPASASYLEKVLADAERDGAALVIVTLSTPGGLLTSTRAMSSAILRSKVPVATFVAPSGAQAASAGFFLLLSGDVAAMAPGTNTGAAHPVGGEGQDLPKNLNEKAEQDARAFIRTLAHQRGRNADRAEAAVSRSVSYTETEAKEGGLVELIARDVPDLVGQLDGRRVVRVGGGETTLALKGARIDARPMGQAERALGVVSDPNVAYVLFLVGLVGLYFELSTPGAVLPGVVGAIALLLALYAFSVLPVNLAGLALILLGIGLFVAEVKVVSHGILAMGGALALLAGSLLLFSGGRGAEGYRVDLGVVLPSLAATLGIVGLLAWKTARLRRLPARTGLHAMVGESGRVADGFGSSRSGRVQVLGEYWEAQGPEGLVPGDTVRVVRATGRILEVERRSS
ncbi:MAG TPA: nodulation protein NfeD [Thermoanaerobaculia bacterium]|nr:nodulation protein NfeD [Thermoanaerobaculia bacterium]